MKILFKILLFFFTVPLFAQDETILQKGDIYVNYNEFRSFTKNNEYGAIKPLTENLQEKTVFEFETKLQPKFIYNFSFKVPSYKRSVEKGQVFLVKFRARTIHSDIETGEARIMTILKQSADPQDGYKSNLDATISVSKEWKTYYIPFTATRNIDKEELSLVLNLGYPAQKFELTDFQVYIFPKDFDTSLLPKTKISYKGMEEDAPWRKEAKARIEKIRKTDFSVTFTKNGKPLSNTEVEFNLERHDFNFGVAAEAKDIVDSPQHLDFITKMFNTIVLENDLKIKAWQNPKRQEVTLDAMDILKKKGLEVKGHTLLWPGFRYLPESFQENKNNPQKIKELSNEFINDVLIKTKGNISHWDVTNENYTNKDLQKITGSDQIVYDAFLKAKMLAPEAERFINEYGIISSGGIDRLKQDWYYNYIKEIDKNTGNAIDGIGMQSHIGSDLTPPTTILSILDRFGTLGKKISISEFTMDVTDPEIRAKYTRDFMIAAFSNPSVNEFLFWGYYEPKSNKAALADKDFQLTPMGKSFESLVKKEWVTHEKLKTNLSGKASGRGFYGYYTYTLKVDNKKYVGVLRLEKGTQNDYVIDLK